MICLACWPVIIYGINPVLEAIKAGRVREIRVAQRADDRLQRCSRKRREHSVRVRYVTRDELDTTSKRGAHQGVVAEVERRTEATLEDLAHGQDGPPLIVVLDEVEDPQNVGAILRTVDACGGIGRGPPDAPGGAPRRGGRQGLGRARSTTCRSPTSSTSPGRSRS